MNAPQSIFEQFDNHIRRGSYKEAEHILEQHPLLWDTYALVTGDTPIHTIVENLIEDRCTWAFEHGANIEKRNKDGLTPLHVAANMDDGHMVDFLIGKGATIEARDNSGATPLLYACAMGCEMAIEHLVKAGADTNALNSDGRSMLGCFLSSSYHHDWEQAAATAEWLGEYYCAPERCEKALIEIDQINPASRGKTSFPGLIAQIQAAALNNLPSQPATKTPSRRF